MFQPICAIPPSTSGCPSTGLRPRSASPSTRPSNSATWFYVSLPAPGTAVTAGEPCGEVESVKSVSDLYSPVDGEVIEVNTELEDDPSLVNAEPYAAGWMFRVRVPQDGNGDPALPADLLSAAEYEELTKSAG